MTIMTTAPSFTRLTSAARRCCRPNNLAQDQYGQASFASLTTFLQGTIKTFTYEDPAWPQTPVLSDHKQKGPTSLD
jgi:hypothetical protein